MNEMLQTPFVFGYEFQQAARRQVEQLDQLAHSRFNAGRMDRLCQTFRDATRLEVGFWQMGVDCSF